MSELLETAQKAIDSSVGLREQAESDLATIAELLQPMLDYTMAAMERIQEVIMEYFLPVFRRLVLKLRRWMLAYSWSWRYPRLSRPIRWLAWRLPEWAIWRLPMGFCNGA